MTKAVRARAAPEAAAKKGGALHVVPRFDPALGSASGLQVTYRRDDADRGPSKAVHLASTKELLEFLEELGVELSDPMIRASLGELYARGSTSIRDVRLSDSDLRRHGLA